MTTLSLVTAVVPRTGKSSKMASVLSERGHNWLQNGIYYPFVYAGQANRQNSRWKIGNRLF